MDNKSDKIFEGSEPGEGHTLVSTAQALDRNDSSVEQPDPSITFELNNAENEVIRDIASPSNESGRNPPHSTENENATRVPSSAQENLPEPCQRPEQGPTTQLQENFDEIRQNLVNAGNDLQNSNPGSSSNRSRDPEGRSENQNSSSTENASSARDLEQNQPFAVRISPLKIRINGVPELPLVSPSTATPPTATPPTATATATPPTTPRPLLPTPSLPTPSLPTPSLPTPPLPTPPSLPPSPQTRAPPTTTSRTNEPGATENERPPRTEPPTTVPTTTTPQIATPMAPAIPTNLPAKTVEQVISSGADPRIELRSRRSSDAISPALRSWINAGIQIQRTMRSLHSSRTPRVACPWDSPDSNSIIAEMMREARSLDGLDEARQDEQELPPALNAETPQRSGNEYNQILADQQNCNENNESQKQSNLDHSTPPHFLDPALDPATDQITVERIPEPPQTPRFSHTHRYSHTTGPLTPLPRVRTPETPLRNVTPPPTPQLRTPRILQLPPPPTTPRAIRLLPTAHMGHFRHPSQDEDVTRSAGQNVPAHGSRGENSTETPQHSARPTELPNSDSDVLGRPPRMPPAPGTPAHFRISRGIASRLPILETPPSASLPPHANAHPILAPPITAGNIQHPLNPQPPSPTGVHEFQDHQHVVNQLVDRQEAVRTLPTVQGNDEMALADAAEESNATDTPGERSISEEEEIGQFLVPTPSCKPPDDHRKEDDDPLGGAGGDHSTGKVLPGTTRTNLKRSQITDTQQRKRQSRGRDRMQNTERDKVIEKSKDPKSNGPSQKPEKILTLAPSASTDESRKHKMQTEMVPVSDAESLQKTFEQLTARQRQRMKKTEMHPISSANRSDGSPDTGGSSKARVRGPQDDDIHRGEHSQDKRNTPEDHAAASKDLNRDRSEQLTNAPRSNPVDPLRSDGNGEVLNGAPVQPRPSSSSGNDTKQVSERQMMKKKSPPRGGRDSPEIEAWLEEPWLPKPKRYSSEDVIRAKDVRIYKTIPKQARRRSSEVPTPQQDEPSAAERQERLRLHLARLGCEMQHSGKEPASG